MTALISKFPMNYQRAYSSVVERPLCITQTCGRSGFRSSIRPLTRTGTACRRFYFLPFILSILLTRYHYTLAWHHLLFFCIIRHTLAHVLQWRLDTAFWDRNNCRVWDSGFMSISQPSKHDTVGIADFKRL